MRVRLADLLVLILAVGYASSMTVQPEIRLSALLLGPISLAVFPTMMLWRPRRAGWVAATLQAWINLVLFWMFIFLDDAASEVKEITVIIVESVVRIALVSYCCRRLIENVGERATRVERERADAPAPIDPS